MKILFIGNYLQTSSTNQNTWADLTRQLSNEGHTIFNTSSKTNKFIRLLDILTTIWSKRSFYEIAEVDVFSGQAFLFAFLGSILLRLINKPFVLTLHGGNLPVFAQRHTKLIKKLLNSATTVVVPSSYLWLAMQPYRTDLVIIPNAIFIERYEFKKRVDIQPNLIWLRAFHEIYNPELAIRVLTNVRIHYPESKLLMIGPDKGDNSYSRTKQLANELGLEKAVTFIEGVKKEEVPIWLNNGDVLINTTNYDNTPISVMEAMACGLCIVSTNIGGIPYLIDNEVNGILVPPNDSVSMASAVVRILTEPGLSAKLSMSARQKAEKLDWAEIFPKWEELFGKLI